MDLGLREEETRERERVSKWTRAEWRMQIDWALLSNQCSCTIMLLYLDSILYRIFAKVKGKSFTEFNSEIELQFLFSLFRDILIYIEKRI